MKNHYLKLTPEQRARGVIFSSELLPQIGETRTIHEVKADAPERDERIARLLDDKSFNAGPYKYNEVRR